MADFQPITNSNSLPRGFRPVRLNLNSGGPPLFNQPQQTANRTEVIYDEPCSNFEANSHQQVPPPLPSSQPPNASTVLNGHNEQLPRAQPFWTLPTQEQEQLQQHLSRSPTPTFGANSQVVPSHIQKVITDKEPPANAEFLYETDAFKFYTVPASSERKVVNVRQTTSINQNGFTTRTGNSHRHGSDWYKTMFKNMHVTDQPKWMYEEPIKMKKKKPKKDNLLEEPPKTEFFYENQAQTNQYQVYQDEKRRKKELQKEVQREHPYIMADESTNYVIKKKKTTKSKSPVSRKTYALIQKGEDIPFSGLNRPAPKSKDKTGFYEQKQREQAEFISRSPSPRPDHSRSPTPGSLTYPASDYVPERPPTPQYIYSQHAVSQYSDQQQPQHYNAPPPAELQSPSTHIYSQQSKTTRNSKRKTDFTSIDEWHRKITDDFNQLYSNLERNFELKRMRETGKLVSPVPPSESRRQESGYTARELYLDQPASAPKPLARKFYLEPPSNKPLSANELFDSSYKSNQYSTTSSTTRQQSNTTRDWLDSSNKLNRYNSSQDLNYLNPNNKYDFNNNLLSTDHESFKRSIYQHSSLDNLNSGLAPVDPAVHNYSYKIFAQPTTTRTLTESTYYDTSAVNQPVIDLKTTKTTNSFQFQKQTSLLDIEKQLNEQFGDLLRCTSSFDDRKDNLKTESPVSNITINVSAPKSSPHIQQSISSELEKLTSTASETAVKQPVVEEEIRVEQAKPLALKPDQDVNNVSFNQMEEDVDLDKLIKKIEQDAILQDDLGTVY